MVMGACPGQIPISCVPLTLMVTATVVRACRYIILTMFLTSQPYDFDAFAHTGAPLGVERLCKVS